MIEAALKKADLAKRLTKGGKKTVRTPWRV